MAVVGGEMALDGGGMALVGGKNERGSMRTVAKDVKELRSQHSARQRTKRGNRHRGKGAGEKRERTEEEFWGNAGTGSRSGGRGQAVPLITWDLNSTTCKRTAGQKGAVLMRAVEARQKGGVVENEGRGSTA